MSNLVPTPKNSELIPTVGVGLSDLAGNDRRANRALQNVQRHTLVRLASVQGHAMVQTEKLHEIDRLTREAVSGQALLSHWAATLAKGDAFLADELKFFTDLARIGKGEIVADTVSDFCQEGRR
jgi:hypothetical protein